MRTKTQIQSYIIALSAVSTLLAAGIILNGRIAEAIDLDQAVVEATFELGFGGEGATWDGNFLWITDTDSVSIKKYSTQNGTLNLVGSIPLNAGGFGGLAWDGDFLWTSSGDPYNQIDPSDGSVVKVVVSPGTSSRGGLTFDGQYLWKASRPEFNQIDPVTGTIIDVISGFDLPGIEEGLTFDGQFLYAISVNNPNDPKIWKIDPISGALLPDSFALPRGLYNGLAFDGRSLWAVNWSEKKLHQISTFPVPLDIKPQACPNPLNVKSRGVLPVAILGTADFDVTQIDPASIRLEGVPPLRSNIEDVATPFDDSVVNGDCLECTAEGPDGFDDLTLNFDAQDVVDAIRPVRDGDCLLLKLIGNLFDGTAIEGEDVVIILKKGR